MAFAAGTMLTHNEPVVRAATATAPAFNRDIAPILTRNCLACHSSSVHKSGLVLETYDALMKGGRHGRPIVPHDADNSLMMQMLDGDQDPQMPLNAGPLSARDVATIKAWIAAGAEGPAPAEAAQRLSSAPAPEIKQSARAVSPVTAVQFSPDGRLLAVGGYKEVRLIDPDSGDAIATLAGHAGYVRSIAFSPDGTMMAAAGGVPQQAGEIRIWKVASREEVQTIAGHTDAIYSIAWSPDGKLIASGSYDKAIKLWSAESGKEVRTLLDHIDAVFAVAFTPDSRRLASASQDRTVKLWDVESGRRLFTLSDALDGLTSVAFSPVGDAVAAAGYDKTIYVWTLGDREGRLSQSLIADQDSVLSLVWSPDGKSIVTASSDGSIRARNSRLELTGVADRQPDWVQALAMNRDGKRLAAGRYNGTVSLYDAASLKECRAPMTVFSKPGAPAAPKETASR